MFTATTRNKDRETFSSVMQRLRLGLLGLAAAVLCACGADDSGNPPITASACADCGTALLTITDAEGDFLSYTVALTSLQLKKANGAVVQTLPVSSDIDFAELVELSEVLSVGQIPAGQYVAATLGVDYLMLGAQHRFTMAKLLKGNVVERVAAGLPEDIQLIIHG